MLKSVCNEVNLFHGDEKNMGKWKLISYVLMRVEKHQSLEQFLFCVLFIYLVFVEKRGKKTAEREV